MLVLIALIASCTWFEEEPPPAPNPLRRAVEVKGARVRKSIEAAPAAGQYFRGLPGLTVSGEAAALFDIDLDEDLDLVVVDGSSSFHVLRNDLKSSTARIPFATLSRPISKVDGPWSFRAKGLGLHDFNHDGYLDLYLANAVTRTRDPKDRDSEPPGGHSTLVYDGNGIFRRHNLGIDSKGYKRTAVFDDFDRDGYFDAYVSNSAYYGSAWIGKGEPNALYPGNKNGFGDSILEAMTSKDPNFWVGDDGRTQKNFKGTVVRDFDGDGKPDIVTASLADLWAKSKYALTTEEDPGFQGRWARGVYVFQNRSSQGKIQFQDVSHDAIPNAYGVEDQPHVHAVVPGDYDNDGDYDLIFSGYKGLNGHNSLKYNTAILRYFENVSTPGKIAFVERTARAGFESLNDASSLPGAYPVHYEHLDTSVVLYPSMLAGASVDVDNDGDLDFIAVDRQITNRNPQTGEALNLHAWLFMNDGNAEFTLVGPHESGLWGTGRDLSYGDINLDGRLDLVLVDGSGGGQKVSNTTRAFVNITKTSNRFIGLQLSLPDNGFGIGVRARLFDTSDGSLVGMDDIRTDFCYRSKRDARLHFGVGEREKVSAEFELANGSLLRVDGLDSNHRYAIWLRDWRWDSTARTVTIALKQTDRLRLERVQEWELNGHPLAQVNIDEDDGGARVDLLIPSQEPVPDLNSEIRASVNGLTYILRPNRLDSGND